MIVLYNPASTHSKTKPLPMSLLALASRLEPDFEWALVDGNVSADPVAEISEIVSRKQVAAVAVTVMPGPQLIQAVPHSRQLKASFPDIQIVWGGYFPSQHDDVSLRTDFVDYCIRGQGEESFRQLLGVLKRGGSLESVPGLSWMDGGRLRQNPTASLVPLDDLPDWPYEKLPMQHYIHSHYMGNRVADHHSSYGCPFGCNFCAVVELSKRRWVAQSPERVERIVAKLHTDFSIDSLMFHDMDYFISESRSAEIAERIRRFNLRWWAMGRIDELLRYSDSTWQKLRESGLKMVFCGAEAGSDETLNRMNKGGKAEINQTLEFAKRAREYGVVPEFSFVVGLPPDPEEDALRTIEFTRRLKEVSPEAELIFYQYTPVPAPGLLSEAAADSGFRFPETLEEWMAPEWQQFSMRRHRHSAWLNKRVGRMVANYESVVNANFPTSTDPGLTGFKRKLISWFGGWRYRHQVYRFPLELRALHYLLSYRRPETTGF